MTKRDFAVGSIVMFATGVAMMFCTDRHSVEGFLLVFIMCLATLMVAIEDPQE